MKLQVMVCAVLITMLMSAMAESADKTSGQKMKPSGSVATASAKSAVIKPVIEPTTGMEFVLVKGGCFQMGDVFGDGDAHEKPVHEVCVSDFYLGKYEVTQGQWEKVMGTNPANRKKCGPDCPVDSVSWNMIQEFVTKLNSKGTTQYRLPTEAEWEYAARSGGKKEKWAGTVDEKALVEFAWHDMNSDSPVNQVGKKKPNSLGLYDMSGNILEWCQDVYDETYYGASPKDNPSGPADGPKRVLRGGYSGREVKELRTTHRIGDDPAVWDGDYGFRLLRVMK